MVGTPSPTPAVETSERRIDELFFGLRVIVVRIEPAPVNSFNPPIGGAAWCVAHDEHPSVAVVHPFTEPVLGFDAVRARPATITLVALGHPLGLSAGARVPVDLHWRGAMTKHPISAVSAKDQLIAAWGLARPTPEHRLPLHVDLDTTLTVAAGNCYRLVARTLPRYELAALDRIWRHFLDHTRECHRGRGPRLSRPGVTDLHPGADRRRLFRIRHSDRVVGWAQAALRLPTALITTHQNLRGIILPRIEH